MTALRIKTLILMVLATIGTTMGDIYLARTIRGIGEMSLDNLSQFVLYAERVISNGQFWMAILMFAIYFFLWIYVLSYEDLSYALPLTALTYVFNAILVGPMLGEDVNFTRWLGTILIVIGVFVVSITTEHSNGQNEAEPEAAAATPAA